MDYDTDPTFAKRYLGAQPSLAAIRANHLADAYHGSGAAEEIGVLVAALDRAERERDELAARIKGIEDRTIAWAREPMFGKD